MSQIPKHNYDFERMVREADDALYAAKHSGRNQVFFFPEGTARNGVAVQNQPF